MVNYSQPITLAPASSFQAHPTRGCFIQGAVAGVCLSAFQSVDSRPAWPQIAQHGLQSGVALAAGVRAADYALQGRYLPALLAASLGGAAVLTIDRLFNLPKSSQGTHV